MPKINFKTTLFEINSWIILRLPDDASAKLPSRGQTMVEGTINGYQFRTPLEPDGRGSHWFRPDKKMLEAIGADAGETISGSIEPIKTWPEPDVPADLRNALAANAKAQALWQDVTPLAHWEWIRWIRSTGKDETRQRRIEVACSKLSAGKRRPCCWNRNLCTEPSVSKNGALLLPA